MCTPAAARAAHENIRFQIGSVLLLCVCVRSIDMFDNTELQSRTPTRLISRTHCPALSGHSTLGRVCVRVRRASLQLQSLHSRPCNRVPHYALHSTCHQLRPAHTQSTLRAGKLCIAFGDGARRGGRRFGRQLKLWLTTEAIDRSMKVFTRE